MSRIELAAIIAALLALVAIVALPIAIVSHHSTERLKACVENGGAYVQVPERTTMECQR